MDEPLSNLDAKMRLQMRDVILDLVREAGITTVFVTHDQEEALAMSDRIAIMDHSRIAQLGTPEELYGTPVNAYVADFIGSANVIPVPAQAVPGQAPQGLVRYQLCEPRLRRRAGRGQPGRARRADRAARGTGVDGARALRPQHLPGKVLRRQYLGFKTAYRIALEDGSELRVELHAGNMVAQFQPGEAVQVLIPADSRVVNA
ncbi:TOBE domain-containing protein [Achromobacter xylosoxidans]